jgi:hypothetical protein
LDSGSTTPQYNNYQLSSPANAIWTPDPQRRNIKTTKPTNIDP